MADQQEQFSYEEYKTYKRVAKMLAEDGGEPDHNSGDDKKQPVYDDPRDAFMADQRKLRDERERKHNYTDEERKMMRDLVNRSR